MNRLEAARWTSARPTGNSHELEVGQAPTTSFASSGTRPIVVQEAPATTMATTVSGSSALDPMVSEGLITLEKVEVSGCQ